MASSTRTGRSASEPTTARYRSGNSPGLAAAVPRLTYTNGAVEPFHQSVTPWPRRWAALSQKRRVLPGAGDRRMLLGPGRARQVGCGPQPYEPGVGTKPDRGPQLVERFLHDREPERLEPGEHDVDLGMRDPIALGRHVRPVLGLL